jgi:hypothetical protein
MIINHSEVLTKRKSVDWIQLDLDGVPWRVSVKTVTNLQRYHKRGNTEQLSYY